MTKSERKYIDAVYPTLLTPLIEAASGNRLIDQSDAIRILRSWDKARSLKENEK